MPYNTPGEMNPALKGIRPKITAAQGTLIASWADAMTKEGKVKSPWSVAISKFKRDYTVRGGKWVKRTDLKKELQNMAINMNEASKNAGDYLIVDDPEKPTTWHLQVKKEGTPDHGLMGDAWAALHSGFRGNKYEGPDKSKALTKLKALYKSENVPEPASEVAEQDYELPTIAVMGNATSFKQLDDMKNAADQSA
jgi:hypothetical protein